MNYNFQLSCESTVDMPYEYISGRDISVIFYNYVIDNEEYVDNMGRDPKALEKFYAQIKAGKLPSTSQINTFRYEEYFDDLLKKGDVLHIAFGTGMTPSYNNAVEAAEKMREKYPERKLIVVDSLCSCTGYGIFVDSAADMRDNGASMEEIEKWLYNNRYNVHHQFFCTDVTMFKRSGRVSGPIGTIASVLGICPIMHLNRAGKIINYTKARSKKVAIKMTVDEVMDHIRDGKNYNDKFYIAHSNCIELAKETRRAFLEYFPDAEERIKIVNIGTIIASHCGEGTVAIFFYGDERID
ncbi:MAG: DegV family protein [Clostridia bacterium]|nr:DegV family protein [Clostridia bacterium]